MENETTRPDMSVLIMSYDGFSDVWDVCDRCFEKYWNADSAVYLATNEKEPDLRKLNVFKIGDLCYSQGIKKFADECENEYILLLLADFLPKENIGNEELCKLLASLKKEGADYCSLYKQKDKSKYYKKHPDYDNLLLVDAEFSYAVNMMPAIWKTSYLRDLAGMGEFNPWEFEVGLQQDARLHEKVLQAKNLYCIEELYPMCHAVIKGKYTSDAVKFFKKENISVDYEKRKKMSFSENLKTKLADSLSRKSKDRIKKILKRLGVKFYVEK